MHMSDKYCNNASCKHSQNPRQAARSRISSSEQHIDQLVPNQRAVLQVVEQAQDESITIGIAALTGSAIKRVGYVLVCVLFDLVACTNVTSGGVRPVEIDKLYPDRANPRCFVKALSKPVLRSFMQTTSRFAEK